jgi:hypothetical protein
LDRDIAEFALDYASGKKLEYAEVRAHSEKSEGLTMKNGVLDAYASALLPQTNGLEKKQRQLLKSHINSPKWRTAKTKFSSLKKKALKPIGRWMKKRK